MKIKSISDVITNSSSEVFVIRKPENSTTGNEDSLKYSLISKAVELDKATIFHSDSVEISEGSSLFYEEYRYKSLREYIDSYYGIKIPEDSTDVFIIDIDQNFCGAISWLFENYEVIGSISEFCPVAYENENFIRKLFNYDYNRVTKENWEKLKDHPYLPGVKILEDDLFSIFVQISDKKIYIETVDSSKISEKKDKLEKILPKNCNILVEKGEPRGKYEKDFLIKLLI